MSSHLIRQPRFACRLKTEGLYQDAAQATIHRIHASVMRNSNLKNFIRKARRCMALFAVAVCAFTVSTAHGQNQVIQSSPPPGDMHETYRLRVENALYGRVEVSLDEGKSYILVGRVVRSATFAAQDKAARQAGVVLRSSSDGVAFAVSAGFALKIRPASAAHAGVRPASLSSSSVAEIITSVSSDKGLFGKLLPPVGSRVMFQPPAHNPGAFPEGYSVSPSDAFVLMIDIPAPIPFGPSLQTDAELSIAFQHSLRALFESIAADYRDGAIQRAVADKRKVVTGTLTLRPNLPPDEPDPIMAVTYVIDESDNVVCASAAPPYQFKWDTTTTTDGEHVVEVRGLGANGNVVTRVRYLVVINNHKNSS